MTSPIVKTSTTADESAIIDVLTLAFSTNPLARWLWADPRQYLLHVASYLKLFWEQAFVHESAYFIDGYAGAALWLPPGADYDKDALTSLLKRIAPEQILEDAVTLFEQAAGYHPSEPHWYLPVIGVDPHHQHKGYGSVLMRHAITPCDFDDKPAYFESSNEECIALFEQQGFEALGTIQVGTSPTIVPMVRKPR